jgi:hypothetical protein
MISISLINVKFYISTNLQPANTRVKLSNYTFWSNIVRLVSYRHLYLIITLGSQGPFLNPNFILGSSVSAIVTLSSQGSNTIN